MELYPAESRLVDTVNQSHLWVVADPAIRFSFGFMTRVVAEGPYASAAVQRSFPLDARPPDLYTGVERAERASRNAASAPDVLQAQQKPQQKPQESGTTTSSDNSA